MFRGCELGGMRYHCDVAAVKFTVGNEKLVKVLDGASSHLRGLVGEAGT